MTNRSKGFAGLQSLLSEVHGKPEAPDNVARSVSLASDSTDGSSPSADVDTAAAIPRVQSLSQAPPSSSPGWYPVVIGASVIGGVVLLLANAGRDQEGVPAAPAAPVAAISVASSIVETPAKEVLAVAAKNANLRATPQGKAKIIGTLPRGATVLVLGESEGFVRCKAGKHAEGWIARSVLIPEADATRLAGISPDDYVESRKGARVLEKMIAHLETLNAELMLVRTEAMTRSPAISETISQLESHTRPTNIPIDTAAGTWFSLEARALLDSGDDIGSARSARAAVFGDPLNADYHAALGYAAIRSANKEIVSAAGTILLALAPGSTNTWVIVGVAAANDELPPLASGSFIVAIQRSKSRSTTIKVLKDLSNRANDERIRSAVEAAITEAADQPGSSASEPSTSAKSRS